MATKTKEERINLRLHSNVLKFFKKRSQKEGIPYQSIINQVLNKYAKGELMDKSLEGLSKKVDKIYKKIANF